MAAVATQIATAAASLSWMFAEWIVAKKPSVLGMVSGAVAGLVAITPASGFVNPTGALYIGIAAGVVCYLAAVHLKKMIGYDDALDCWGVHGIGGALGAILTGVFASSKINSAGKGWLLDGNFHQVILQFIDVGVVFVYCAVMTFIILAVLKYTIGIRVSEEVEIEGLDINLHGEVVHGLSCKRPGSASRQASGALFSIQRQRRDLRVPPFSFVEQTRSAAAETAGPGPTSRDGPGPGGRPGPWPPRRSAVHRPKQVAPEPDMRASRVSGSAARASSAWPMRGSRARAGACRSLRQSASQADAAATSSMAGGDGRSARPGAPARS